MYETCTLDPKTDFTDRSSLLQQEQLTLSSQVCLGEPGGILVMDTKKR